MNDDEINLLMDIYKLFKKYHPDTFISLAKTISLPEINESLIKILSNVPKYSIPTIQSPSKLKGDKKPRHRSIVSLQDTEPEKYKLLNEFSSDLENKKCYQR